MDNRPACVKQVRTRKLDLLAKTVHGFSQMVLVMDALEQKKPSADSTKYVIIVFVQLGKHI